MKILTWLGIGLAIVTFIGFLGILVTTLLADPWWPIEVIYAIIYYCI